MNQNCLIQEIEYFRAYHGRYPKIYIGKETLRSLLRNDVVLNQCEVPIKFDDIRKFAGCDVKLFEISQFGFYLE
jgi:hypothetical protein